MNNLTQEEVKRLFDYNPETGDLIWKRRYDVLQNWNTKHAGKIAGTFRSDGYVKIRIGGKKYFAHRLVWLWVYGYLPKKDIDHINKCSWDNKIENLREATDAENQQNVRRRIDNSSGYSGVHYRTDSGKWRAYINVAGKTQHLGSFCSKDLAVKAREAAEAEYFGYLKQAKLNTNQLVAQTSD